MSLSNGFRALLVFIAIVIGYFGLTATIAVFLSRRLPPPKDAQLPGSAVPETPAWLSLHARFHSGVAGNQALILVIQALQRDGPNLTFDNDSEGVRGKVRKALLTKPYDAELWLALGLLEAKHDPEGPAAVEALRMTYLTAPNTTYLMPMRLNAATHSDALKYPDLRELVLGDIRLMLTRLPNQRLAIQSAYQQASKVGKTFLQDAIGSIDPAFLETLRG